jgi:hypothetical protein
VHRPLRVDSADGMRAGERKTGWTKPLPPSPGLWALNAPGRLLVGRRGIPGGGLEPFAVPTRVRLKNCATAGSRGEGVWREVSSGPNRVEGEWVQKMFIPSYDYFRDREDHGTEPGL